MQLNDTEIVPEPETIEQQLGIVTMDTNNNANGELHIDQEFEQELVASTIAINIQDISHDQEELLVLEEEIVVIEEEEEVVENKVVQEEKKEDKVSEEAELVELEFILEGTNFTIEMESNFTVSDVLKLAEV